MRQRNSRTGAVKPTIEMTEAKAYEEHSLKELRAAGYRITSVVGIGHFRNIHEKIINGSGKIDVVSVYRILATLHEVGLIHHIGVVDGYFPSRLGTTGGKQSEVVVFDESNDVEELVVPDELVAIIAKQAKERGFEVTSLKVEITGKRK